MTGFRFIYCMQFGEHIGTVVLERLAFSIAEFGIGLVGLMAGIDDGVRQLPSPAFPFRPTHLKLSLLLGQYSQL